MHYNWPKFEYLGGMKLKARETENWRDHPIRFINIKYTQILANYNAWRLPNSSLHMVFIIYPYELDNPQDPAELEQDHTCHGGFKVVVNNDDTKHLEINAGRNPSKTPHTCAAPKPMRRQIKHGTTHPLWRVCGAICRARRAAVAALLRSLTFETNILYAPEGDVSNEHATDENAPSEWPREPHLPWRVWPIYGYIKYHTPAAAGVWYYKILDSNPNEPPTPNLPNEHPANEDPASRTPRPQTRQTNTRRMKIRRAEPRDPPNDPNPPS
ncbi:hypothetical protein BS47DRAFT_1366553 [Hydnum rufescens UP504]|uniref:Uncharacterized protein n=1 Tax=Hydnum rufescens UP504 TaxID=1448309 RepID=A0A9P6AKR5_9AGAM|nr:hypothetical protein BS47DRAFT_1366553 [Hydnum rufescens UP504]